MIQPGLERISALLKNVQPTWKAIHVAGTNGKGSICAHASALLTRKHIPNGRFTSPHIINKWDGITINDRVVKEADFREAEAHFLELNERDKINASEFELLTATAFKLFNDAKIEVGVVEVGMGGTLDATNILNNQVVCAISKIARDHEAFLGKTLAEIARHKAGILRPGVPYVVNPINEPSVLEVIKNHAQEIKAGPQILVDTPELRYEVYSTKAWHQAARHMMPFQRDNAVLGLFAFVHTCNALKRHLPNHAIDALLPVLENNGLPGRLRLYSVAAVFGNPKRRILADGAHNVDAAKALSDLVTHNYRTSDRHRRFKRRPRPITWVLAMTEGKDARRMLGLLLRPGDTVVTTSFGSVDGMPWVTPMDPVKLSALAKVVEPGVTSIPVPKPGVLRALCTARYLCGPEEQIVLTGSLYLVGDFLRARQEFDGHQPPDLREVHKEEVLRANAILSPYTSELNEDVIGSATGTTGPASMKAKHQATEIEAELSGLDAEIQVLQEQEETLARAQARQPQLPEDRGNDTDDSMRWKYQPSPETSDTESDPRSREGGQDPTQATQHEGDEAQGLNLVKFPSGGTFRKYAIKDTGFRKVVADRMKLTAKHHQKQSER